MGEAKIFENPVPDERAIEEALRGKIRFFNNVKSDALFNELMNKINEISAGLLERYPDARKSCYLFHVLIGSSTTRKQHSIFDFPGEDSIAKQINDLYEQYKDQ